MNQHETLDLLEAMAPVISPQDPALQRARAAVDEQIGVARRPHWLRWGVAASVAAGAAIALVAMPGTSQNAFASWVPVAAAATTAQVAAAQHECDTALRVGDAQAVAAERSTGVDMPNLPASDADLADRTARLAEQRGQITFVLSANASWMVGCLAAPGVDPALTGASIKDRSLLAAPPSATTVDLLDSADEGGADGRTASLVWGRAGKSVTAVELQTADGTALTASVRSGYWSAWWPSSPSSHMSSTTVTVTLDDGSTHTAGTVGDLDADLDQS